MTITHGGGEEDQNYERKMASRVIWKEREKNGEQDENTNKNVHTLVRPTAEHLSVAYSSHVSFVATFEVDLHPRAYVTAPYSSLRYTCNACNAIAYV